MNNRIVKRIACLIIFIILAALLNGCAMTAYQTIDKLYKKNPNNLQNVPPSGPTAIDGVWFNPGMSEQFSIILGREVNFVQITPRDPILPYVLVKDIKLVAPGRYRGIPLAETEKYNKVTYSILSESKLLTRWHYKNGEKRDVVYDKVKLTYEKRYLDEYKAFLKESQEKGTSPVQTAEGQVSKSDEGPDSSTIQVRKGGLVSKVIIHRMYTDPAGIKPGEKFRFVIDYSVSDTSVNTKELPVTLNIEVLKSKSPATSASAPPTSVNTLPVHTFDPAELTCINGQRGEKIVHLKATNEKGGYYLSVRLAYGEQTTKSFYYFAVN